MKVLLAPRATRDVQVASLWWRRNRDAASLFEDELFEALAQLGRAPHVGVLTRRRSGGVIRRVHLKKTRYLVYYAVDEAKRQVQVLRVWHMNRPQPPL